jgi:hypothetical protein
MKLVWTWVPVVLNLVSAAVYCVLMARLARRQKKLERQAYDAVVAETTKFMPAIAFCFAMSHAEGVPETVRQMAKSAIPESVEITVTNMPASSKVH